MEFDPQNKVQPATGSWQILGERLRFLVSLVRPKIKDITHCAFSLEPLHCWNSADLFVPLTCFSTPVSPTCSGNWWECPSFTILAQQLIPHTQRHKTDSATVTSCVTPTCKPCKSVTIKRVSFFKNVLSLWCTSAPCCFQQKYNSNS